MLEAFKRVICRLCGGQCAFPILLEEISSCSVGQEEAEKPAPLTSHRRQRSSNSSYTAWASGLPSYTPLRGAMNVYETLSMVDMAGPYLYLQAHQWFLFHLSTRSQPGDLWSNPQRDCNALGQVYEIVPIGNIGIFYGSQEKSSSSTPLQEHNVWHVARFAVRTAPLFGGPMVRWSAGSAPRHAVLAGKRPLPPR